MSHELKQVDVRLKLTDKESVFSREVIDMPEKAVSVLAPVLAELDREEVCVVNLDGKGRPINFSVVSIGSVNTSFVTGRELYKSAILSNAAAMIMLHNHPSSDLKISMSDRNITEKMMYAGILLDIDFYDHIIVAGRTGEFIKKTESWSNVIYMPCTKATNFAPEIPKETPDIIYLCFPNNPTGSTITKDQLQEWVDYANKVGAVIIYDAAYEAYISEDNVPHTIYECDGAKTCAIELRSFSKNAGFTGTRLGFTVIPKELESNGTKLNALWARRHGTKFNGAPYIIQRAGEAVYSEEGKKQTKAQVAYYMNNAKVIMDGLKNAGFSVSGGVNAPYVWLETPKDMTSWEFFDYLLNNANIVGTPGSGFGPSGEGYFRLTAFGTHENTLKAIERIKNL